MTNVLNLESKSAQLSSLMELVCTGIQLTDSQFERARSAYDTISGWLVHPDSPIFAFDPDVYPQGSMALGTTNKPRDGEEFDVDLVCELRGLTGYRPTRQQLLSMIAARLRSHGTYADRVEIRERCVRVQYTGEFHADIVPALPAPREGQYGSTTIVIPDRAEEKWLNTNPRGYRTWFFSRCAGDRILMEKRADIEPFPRPMESHKKASLQRLVQLHKRRRDVHFEDDCEFAPKSMLLTTLVALEHNGVPLMFDATVSVLDRLIAKYASVPNYVPPPVVDNPSNVGENLARHWRRDVRHFSEFKGYIREFRTKMDELFHADGMPQVAKVLRDLFDPSDLGFVKEAVTKYTELLQESRGLKQIGMTPRGSSLTTAATGMAFKGNSFFGN